MKPLESQLFRFMPHSGDYNHHIMKENLKNYEVELAIIDPDYATLIIYK